MSVDATARAWAGPAKGNDLLVLLALADVAGGEDDPYDHAYPSVPRLARVTKLSDRTVQRCLRTLAEDGLIRKTGEHVWSPSKATNRWRLEAPPRGDESSPPDSSRGDSGGTPGVTAVSPNPSITHPPSKARATAPVRVHASEAGLSPEQRRVLYALRMIADQKGLALDEEKALEACVKFPDRAYAEEAEAMRYWHLEGRGVNSRKKDLTAGWRNWLKGAPPSAVAQQQRQQRARGRQTGAGLDDFQRLAREMDERGEQQA